MTPEVYFLGLRLVYELTGISAPIRVRLCSWIRRSLASSAARYALSRFSDVVVDRGFAFAGGFGFGFARGFVLGFARGFRFGFGSDFGAPKNMSSWFTSPS